MTRLAQGLLAVAGLALWAASRMAWVDVASSDGLGQPKTTTLSGASWSEALVPLALLVLAAAVAVLAVRGWPLRLLALLVAVSSAGMAYLAIGLWVIPDVAVRGAQLAQVPVAALVGTQRHYWGASLSLVAALCTLSAAVLLIRAAARAGSGAGAKSTKYVAPAARRAAARTDETSDAMSERMIWDALDEGHDPTGSDTGTDNEGR
ncbi:MULTISPECIES: TIGR02234 family membrane protein [unclassified Mycobacterium]|uniref:TIGR02234 family membrane protein n=1 Tax=unclassified Mycobacterium TaxID=2642494 RepID=UPI0029C8BB4B|nr:MULTISPECIES: TIGR02234 family membrane protein [unclassified Mycobacterium]